MVKVEIYTSMFCGYCMRAINLLKEKKVEIQEIDVGGLQEHWQEMQSRAGGQRTVPQIFIEGQHVGGCDNLMALEASGKLDDLLTIHEKP